MIKRFLKKLLPKKNFNSPDYWENRYAAGGNSGDGSYGRLAIFKADFINRFIRENEIKTAAELGCGDGHQLSLIQYPFYTGMDISATVIAACRKKFAEDRAKKFIVYDPLSTLKSLEKVDMALSLDVLYHIIEETNYMKYMSDLFGIANRFVIIYSTNFSLGEAQHVQHRKFTETVTHSFKDWELMQEVANPFQGTGEQESLANFFIFRKIINE